jgi:hypothetical protein
MKKRVVLVVLLVLAASAAGFSQLTIGKQPDDMKALTIVKQIGSRSYYKKVKTITKHDKIEAFYDLLVRADWKSTEVSMTHPPDYKINNLYFIWLTPQRKHLEVFIEGKSKYTKLSEKDSHELFEMMTGKELGN